MLIKACEGGSIEVVRYLLTSSELTDHANINTRDEMPLCTAYKNDHLELIHYLLTSPELIKHANVYNEDNNIFNKAIQDSNIKIIDYLIFDYKIKKNHKIEYYIDELEIEENNIAIIEKFKKRDLIEKLEQELKNDNKHNNKIKL